MYRTGGGQLGRQDRASGVQDLQHYKGIVSSTLPLGLAEKNKGEQGRPNNLTPLSSLRAPVPCSFSKADKAVIKTRKKSKNSKRANEAVT